MTEFEEVDAEQFMAALERSLDELGLTDAELLLGKVDENGEVVWGGCPAAIYRPNPLDPLHRLIRRRLWPNDPWPAVSTPERP